MNYFWTNTIWYVILGMTTVFEVMCFMIKTNNRKLILALFLTICGFAFAFEISIYDFFKGYMYYPMIIQDTATPDKQIAQQLIRFHDGLIGNFFSQYSVAATAVLITALKLRKYWYFIFAGLFGGIEELFKYLGIYEQYWYQTWMTVIALLLLFWITEKLYNKICQGMGSVMKYIAIFFGMFGLYVFFKDIPLVLCDFYYGLYILPDPTISDSIIFTIENLLLFSLIMIAYFRKFKGRWHALIVLFLLIISYFAWKFNYILVNANAPWFLIFTAGSILETYLFVFIVDRLYEQGKNNYNYKTKRT
jgi:hypothetical protein